jgi:hypothetical protein
MAQSQWLQIRYWDFYDVPRLFAVTDLAGRHLLFDCQFDEVADEYQREYVVYELTNAEFETVGEGDWKALIFGARRLGTLPVASLRFDPTGRNYVHVGAAAYFPV